MGLAQILQQLGGFQNRERCIPIREQSVSKDNLADQLIANECERSTLFLRRLARIDQNRNSMACVDGQAKSLLCPLSCFGKASGREQHLCADGMRVRVARLDFQSAIRGGQSFVKPALPGESQRQFAARPGVSLVQRKRTPDDFLGILRRLLVHPLDPEPVQEHVKRETIAHCANMNERGGAAVEFSDQTRNGSLRVKHERLGFDELTPQSE